MDGVKQTMSGEVSIPTLCKMDQTRVAKLVSSCSAFVQLGCGSHSLDHLVRVSLVGRESSAKPADEYI